MDAIWTAEMNAWLGKLQVAEDRLDRAEDKLRYFYSNDPDLFDATEEDELKIDLHLAREHYNKIQDENPQIERSQS
jgi:hypothetical protein